MILLIEKLTTLNLIFKVFTLTLNVLGYLTFLTFHIQKQNNWHSVLEHFRFYFLYLFQLQNQQPPFWLFHLHVNIETRDKITFSIRNTTGIYVMPFMPLIYLKSISNFNSLRRSLHVINQLDESGILEATLTHCDLWPANILWMLDRDQAQLLPTLPRDTRVSKLNNSSRPSEDYVTKNQWVFVILRHGF